MDAQQLRSWPMGSNCPRLLQADSLVEEKRGSEGCVDGSKASEGWWGAKTGTII